MKQLRRSFLTKPLGAFLFLCTLSLTMSANGNGELTVTAGTIVPIQSSEKTVFDKSHFEGEIIHFKVTSDVTVNGQTVIKGGTLVDGLIKSIEQAKGLGKPGSVTIDFSNVKAVDGTLIQLSSCPINRVGEKKLGLALGLGLGLGLGTGILPLLALMAIKGTPAVIEAGTNVNCSTTTVTIVKN